MKRFLKWLRSWCRPKETQYGITVTSDKAIIQDCLIHDVVTELYIDSKAPPGGDGTEEKPWNGKGMSPVRNPKKVFFKSNDGPFELSFDSYASQSLDNPITITPWKDQPE